MTGMDNELKHGGLYAVLVKDEDDGSMLWVIGHYDAGSETFFNGIRFWELIEVYRYVYLQDGDEIPDDYEEPTF